MNNHIVKEWVGACKSRYTRYDFFRKYPLDDRVLRLFAVACCREVWDKLIDERSKKAVETAEFYADGLVAEDELKRAYNDAWVAWRDIWRITRKANDNEVNTTVIAFVAAASAAASAAQAAKIVSSQIPNTTEDYTQQGLILASMYPTIFNEQWTTPTTISLSKQIYYNKNFSLMPILADALQDVGCTEDILEYLRGPFYKGNYIIDRLIGKRS